MLRKGLIGEKELLPQLYEQLQINIEAEQQNVESELKKLDELKKRFDQ